MHDRLAAAVPPDVVAGTAHLVHGDFHIDNAVFDDDLRVIAVFDWELATLGHPIADLAWALLFWAEPGEHEPFLQVAADVAPGFPGRAPRSSRPTGGPPATTSARCPTSRRSPVGRWPACCRGRSSARSAVAAAGCKPRPGGADRPAGPHRRDVRARPHAAVLRLTCPRCRTRCRSRSPRAWCGCGASRASLLAVPARALRYVILGSVRVTNRSISSSFMSLVEISCHRPCTAGVQYPPGLLLNTSPVLPSTSRAYRNVR